MVSRPVLNSAIAKPIKCHLFKVAPLLHNERARRE
jgi:hypothetical protein